MCFHLGYGKFSLLGWSDGGMCSLIMAGKYPSIIEKLVVWGCKAYLTKEDLDVDKKFRDVSKWNTKMRQRLEG